VTLSAQAMRFQMFEAFKQRIIQHNDGAPMHGAQSFLAGGLAGGVSVAVNQPVDVVKSNMQGLLGSQYSSSLQCARTIVHSSGVKGLYKGLGIRVVRVSFETAITFSLYGELLFPDTYRTATWTHTHTNMLPLFNAGFLVSSRLID
jgi:hypothetical protein